MPKYREFIREILGDRVVAYYPCLAHRFGVKSAILLSQLFHYASLQEDPKGWFHAKIGTITNHTGLSRKEQGAARKVLSQWGVLKVERRGMPRKNWYLVDLEALVLAVSEGKELPEPSSQESPKGTHKGDPKVVTCEAQRDPCIKESFKESFKEKEEDLSSFSQDEWMQALIAIKLDYYRGRHTAFDQYWGGTGFAGQQDGVFKVSCQEDQQEWLEGNGKKIAENMLVGVLGERVEVEFIVEE